MEALNSFGRSIDRKIVKNALYKHTNAYKKNYA